MTPERFRIIVIVLLLSILGVASAACIFAYRAYTLSLNIESLASYGLAADAFTEKMDALNERIDRIESKLNYVKSRLPQ